MFGLSKPHPQISQVVILDQDFKIIKKITSETMLAQFIKYWDSKKKLPANPEPPGQYKIDIFLGKPNLLKSHRYLYNEKKGTLRILTKTLTPEYQIEELDSFNELVLPAI